MGILGVASQEASEKIGISLIDALIRLSGNDSVQNLASSMERVAQATANTITGFSIMAEKVKQIGKFAGTALSVAAIVAAFLPQGQLVKPAMALIAIAKSKKLLGAAAIIGTVVAGNKLGAKAEDKKAPNVFDRGLNQRALNFATKIVEKKAEAAKLDKAAAATSKLAGMFDLDAIQIAAALKGKISDLDRKSLEAMQALKTEDKNDDITALKELEQAKINADAADRARKIKALQDTISFNKAALDDWQANFDKMNSNATKMLGLSAAAYSVGAPSSTQQTGLQQAQTDLFKGTLPDLSYLNFDLGALGAANAQMEAGIAAQQAANVTVNLQGGINIGSTLEFYQTVQAAVQEATRNGWSLAGTATG
jgi:hypothetical protein